MVAIWAVFCIAAFLLVHRVEAHFHVVEIAAPLLLSLAAALSSVPISQKSLADHGVAERTLWDTIALWCYSVG